MKPMVLVFSLCFPVAGVAQAAPAVLRQAAETEQPVHWNQWRGPQRSGHVSGPKWPERLTKDRLQRLWRVPLGPSYSGPVMDAERVYTTETVDKTEEVVRALDRRTGEEVWQRRWKGAITVPFFAARNGSWIRSTPALDGGSLYVAGMRDVLVCLDAATGAERWRVDFVERFGSPSPDFGFVCSPLVRGDHVYVQAGASFVKVDRKTGEVVWRTLQDQGGMWGSAFSSPVFATIRGQEQLVVQTRSTLNGVELGAGQTLWSTPVRSFRGMNILTPTAWRDGVFTSAYGGRAHYFEVTEAGDAGLAVAEKWTNRAQGYMTSPVVIDDHAYLYLRSKRFACVDLQRGQVAWISPPLGDNYWSLVAQGERILALSEGGELSLIAANPERFERVDMVEISEAETWAHLAVDGDMLFVRELDGLLALRWK